MEVANMEVVNTEILKSEIENRYSFLARSLHWFSAVIILWATLSGIWLSSFQLEEGLKHQIAEFNVSLATVFIPFFFFRMAYRWYFGAPEYDTLKASDAKVAVSIHWLIYILIAVVLLSGVLMMNRNFSLFHLVTLPNLIHDSSVTDSFSALHKHTSRILGVLVVLHMLAVVKHQLKGVNIIRRMI